jgi:hypothetical protein
VDGPRSRTLIRHTRTWPSCCPRCAHYRLCRIQGKRCCRTPRPYRAAWWPESRNSPAQGAASAPQPAHDACQCRAVGALELLGGRVEAGDGAGHMGEDGRSGGRGEQRERDVGRIEVLGQLA